MSIEKLELFKIFKKKDRQSTILEKYSVEQQSDILYKLKILASLAHTVCRDSATVVELNEPGAGWHWNFVENIIRIDPDDVVAKSMNYLRFVVAHEGGHRRITRVSNIIPMEVWMQTGFPFMTNAIEDPRDNSFLAEAYPVIGDHMIEAYSQEFYEDELNQTLADINQSIDEAKKSLGRSPRYMLAGFEYIYQWFKELSTGDESVQVRRHLPDEVRATVTKTIDSVRHSWRHYPSVEEAESEDLIVAYAKASYEINLEQVWPEFRKLIDMDKEDQELQEALKDMKRDRDANAGNGGIPADLESELDDEQKKDLEDRLDGKRQNTDKEAENEEEYSDGDSDETPGVGKSKTSDLGNKNKKSNKKGLDKKNETPSSNESLNGDGVDMEEMSEELKEKIKDYIDGLTEEERRKIKERAEKSLKEFDDYLSEKFSGKFSESPKEQVAGSNDSEPQNTQNNHDDSTLTPEEELTLKLFEQKLKEMTDFDKNIYEKFLRELLPLINALEIKLREVFQERRESEFETKLKHGKKLNIKTAIQEEARGISEHESRAWENIRIPEEQDYAITILVDLSGSMNGEKILATFKAMIVLAEVLNRLSIKLEILGFNQFFYEYKKFDQRLDDELREKMSEMIDRTGTTGASHNDDGWALQKASSRLANEEEEFKFLIVLSDGQPHPSAEHTGVQFELKNTVRYVMKKTSNRLIGLGVGPNTEHVADYYPFNLANISVEQLVEVIGDLLLDVIINYDDYK